MKKLPFSLVLAFLHALCFSQPAPNLVLNQITEENGLSDDHVQCVLKDSQGFVWIGTADGLNLLDGSTVQVFRHGEGDTASLAGNNVLSLAEDQNKNIWIATEEGISCYQKKARKFTAVGLPFSVYGASNIVRTVIAGGHNALWCATDGGLFLYNIQTKVCTPYYNTTAGEKRTAVNKIVMAIADKGGTVWLCTFDGLWLFDTRRLHFTRAVGRANDANYEGLTTAVFEDGERRIWFGNWSKGLKRLDRATGAVASFASLPGAAAHVTGISEIKIPGGQNVLCLSDSLQCFDGTAKRFLPLPKPFGLKTHPAVKNFYRSPDGWTWMGSDKGVWVYNPQRQFFQHYFFQRPITSQSVSLLDWQNDLLIGGEGEAFLSAYDTAYRVKNRYADAAKKPRRRTSADATLCFAKESENTLLVGNSGGILRYNFQTGASRWFTHNDKDSTSLPTNFIQHLLIDSKNRYWVFPWRSGIYDMNPLTGACRLRCKGFLPQQDGTKGLVIADAAEDERGNIWMADLDEGIVLFDGAKASFSKPFEARLGGRSRSARVICRNGVCYAFADDRLLTWDTKTRGLHVIKPPLPMRSYIYDIALDDDGRCWAATKKGLLVYTESANGFKQFTAADGLPDNDMDGSLYARGNGKIVFATPAGLTQFTPQELLQSPAAAPCIFLTGVEANGENTPYDGAQTLRLNYTQNNLLFRWAVTDYTAPFRNRYWCRLQGIDNGWKYVGNKGEIQYANLSPGAYTLFLKAATANGLPSGNVVLVRFKITPPFWKAVWFWAALALLAGSAVFWLVNRRINGIRAHAAVRQQISELELKALKAQINPHFIFNSLSSIQESIVSGNTEAASGYLGKFSKLIRAVLENSDKKSITVSQEIDYLKLYLELESFRFDDFHFSLDAAGVDDAAFIRLPPMLVQPYVENAVKHGLSHKEGAKNLLILFHLPEPDLLQVIVEDDGIGRRQSAVINEARGLAHRPMGLKITEERLRLQKVRPVRRVEISDLLNDEGKATGTRVTLYIAIES